ncbi:protein phosphatase 1 regulatory subunit 1B-like [Pholidichthys leucotaenia]
MDPLLPAETELMEREADKEERRKIQFSVPSPLPTQLDPRQVEMIRRRRPTPATLFRLTDPPSPSEEDSSTNQWILGENGALKTKMVRMSTYQPPSLKAVQKMAQAHLSALEVKSVDIESSSGEEDEQHEEDMQQKASGPREESQPCEDLTDLLGISSESANLSRHHEDKEEAKEN